MPSADELGVLSVQDVLEHTLGIELEAVGRWLRIPCPHPDHEDSNPSAYVNAETGLGHCFSCGAKWDLVRLGVWLTGKTADQVEALLRPGPEGLLEAVKRKLRQVAPKVKTPSLHLPSPADYDPGPLTELRRRGFSQETLERWGVRWVLSSSLPRAGDRPLNINRCFAIPVRDARRVIRLWTYRATKDSRMPKYVDTPGASLKEIWFGEDHHADADHVVVVEGPLDAMWLDQCGVPALAMLGSNNFSAEKAAWLGRYRSVTVLGDRDAAGHAMVHKVGAALQGRVPLKVGLYPRWMPGDDPEKLAPIDVEIVLERAVSWLSWRSMRGLRSG